MTQDDKNPPADDKDLQGEGNYDASRRFDADEKAFIDKHGDDITRLAKEAEEALDGPEGDELRKAEAESRTPARK